MDRNQQVIALANDLQCTHENNIYFRGQAEDLIDKGWINGNDFIKFIAANDEHHRHSFCDEEYFWCSIDVEDLLDLLEAYLYQH